MKRTEIEPGSRPVPKVHATQRNCITLLPQIVGHWQGRFNRVMAAPGPIGSSGFKSGVRQNRTGFTKIGCDLAALVLKPNGPPPGPKWGDQETSPSKPDLSTPLFLNHKRSGQFPASGKSSLVQIFAKRKTEKRRKQYS